MSSQPPPKPPATSNRRPPLPTTDGSTQELSDRETLTRSALLTLLQETKWPTKLEDAARKLVQTINNLPDLPQDVAPVKDSVEELVRVLGTGHESLKEAPDRYGRKKGRFTDGIKRTIPSRRRGKWTDTLRMCQADIEKLSTTLRSRLESLTPIGSVKDSEMPPGHQNQPTSPPADVSLSLKWPGSQGLQKSSSEQAMTVEHPTGPEASVQDSSPDLPEDQEIRSPIRDGALAAARKTLETVEVVSGAVPVVGDFVGVAAKVGLAFVKMIETMDENEDMAKELASHISTLSVSFERIKKSDPENGDDLAAQVHSLQRELESIQKKIDGWDSLSRFRKAFLASYHAEKLKAHQDTVKSSQDKIQLISGLKTLEIVSRLKNSELRAGRQRLLDRLGDGSYGARGNSIEDVVCLPGTRVEILNRIDQWIKDTSTVAERVLWIRGMAGRGKSTIASTVAHRLSPKGSFAIFHFRRGHNASDGQFICALARQLGKGSAPELKNAILGAVRKDEDIARERLDKQFETLLVGPLNKLEARTHPIIIIVDALDECENVADAVRFVRLIDRHSSSLPTNVKFLLTCRPEAPLLVALEPRKWHAEDLDSMSHVFEDVTKFIQHSFAQIREYYDLPDTWPSSADVKSMVNVSQGLFQWARTAITYVGDRSPVNRLKELLQHSSMWGELDYLYRQILSKAFDAAAKQWMRKQLLSWVLEALVVAPYPVSLEVIAFLHAEHGIFQGQENAVQYLRNDILADLNSLLHIPSSPREPLRLMHTSIRDLLENRERCESQHYFVDLVQAHRRLASVTLGIMGRDLRKNICELWDLSKANYEVQDVVEGHVPKGLQYCCRSWSIHLAAGVSWSEANGATVRDIFSNFRTLSEEKLLAWLEVMSVIGATNEAFGVAKQVHRWLEQWPPEMSSGDLITLWNDTQRFIASSVEPISFGALHIYASALPHCPMGTELWAMYGGQATTRILSGERQVTWPANIWTSSLDSFVRWIVISPNGGVLACGLDDATVRLLDAQTGAQLGDPLTGNPDWITFLPDDKVLTSGLYGETVRLWDARTGAQLGGPLTGHRYSITSGVLSPDGKVVASVPDGATVQLCDSRTGAQLGDPLTGHTDWIRSVAFSPDGKVLASGSDDETVRLWDARTGAQLGDALTGHAGEISSIVFSPDGKVLASGSCDCTVRLWDAQTGTQLGDPLTGHTYSIRAVVFSPDSKVLASGSDDETVRLWDARTGTQLGDPLTGHTHRITSVVFSPDGKFLASGSYDETVRLWDARTGVRLGDHLTSHRYRITSVVFSPDSKVLASASDDDTVRLWDTRTGTQLGDPLTSQRHRITSIVFSPDSKVLAAVSDDNIVRLRDARTGVQFGDPLTGHTGRIESVVFSPDGKVLASVSFDKTVRLWDARTGAQLGDPLTGHTYSIRSVGFLPDDQVLASWSEDDMVRLWDTRTGTQLGDPLISQRHRITSIVFSPDSKVLAAVSDDNIVRLRDARTGVQFGDPLTGHTGWIESVVFSPDGKVLASASSDKTVRLWDAHTGAQLGDPLTGHTGWIRSIIFSPDSKVLASASSDKTVRLWDAHTGAQLGDPLTGHTDWIRSIIFSPDSKVLASLSFDKTVQLWDARTGAQLGEPLAGSSIVLSPDNQILVKSANGTLQPWDPLSCQPFAGFLNSFNAQHLSFGLNWILCDSSRLLWLPVHYRHMSQYSECRILFLRGRLALWFQDILFLIDISAFSDSLLDVQ